MNKRCFRLIPQEFDPKQPHRHCMFSEWPVDRIWEGIYDSLRSHSREIKISENKLRMTFEAHESVAEEQAVAQGEE